MRGFWDRSTGNARQALRVGGLALMAFAFPICSAFVCYSIHYVGGVAASLHLLLLFWLLYLALAIPATFYSVRGSKKGQWWRADGGKRFVCCLYGLPFVLVFLIGGLLMKR